MTPLPAATPPGDDSTPSWERVGAAFDEATLLAGEDLADFLERLRHREPAVAREVSALLAADRSTGNLLGGELPRGGIDGEQAADLLLPRDVELAAADDDGTATATRSAGDEAALANTFVGDYRLLRRLGRGGMGEVWEAERADGQFEQRVAVKLLKRGLDSSELVDRFLRERQILARLEHPGITHLLDGGIATDGRPYLVMELVTGQAITDYATARRLGLRQRLELVLEVCAAVEAAHRALIVHRDLKPSNILVTAEGRVKLLDFGVAKLLDPSELGGEEGSPTFLFQAPFTPAYAAPEQILGGAITTACDVYALGIILYELLAGRRPFARRGRRPGELAREVAAERPRPPSEPTATAATQTESTAATHLERAPSTSLLEGLDADLDAIVMQAIRAEPEARYPTVAALAADLRRFLADQPVEAHDGAVAYRWRKFLRRHRLAVASSALALTALLAGAGLAVWQAVRAQREADRAREVERFLVDIFAQADPTHSAGEHLSARQVLDQGAQRIASELADQPAARASLEEALAKSYRGLGLLGEARQHGEQAVALRETLDGPAAFSTASARVTLAAALADAGELATARASLDRAFAVLRRRQAPPLALAEALAVDGYMATQESDNERALASNQESYDLIRGALGDDHVDSVVAAQAVAVALAAVGRLDEAAAELSGGIASLERAGQGAGPLAGIAQTNLGEILDLLDRSAEAETHFRAALRIEEASLGADHPQVAQTLLKLGIFLVQRRRFAEADDVLARAVAILTRLDHFDLANAWRYQGYSALGRGRYADAERAFAAAWERLRRQFGDDHPLTWEAVVSLARARSKLGRLVEAEAMQRQALAALTRLHGLESSELRAPLKNLGETLLARGAVAEAIALHRQALALERKLFGTDEHLAVVTTKRLLALDLVAQPTPANLAEARTLVDAALAYLAANPADSNRLPEFLETSGYVAIAAGDVDRGRRDLADAVSRWTADGQVDEAIIAPARRALARLAAGKR